MANLTGYYDLTNPKTAASLQGGTLTGPAIFKLGGADTSVGLRGATSTRPSTNYLSGWDSTQRQRYIDQAKTEAQTQIGNQLAASSRRAAQMGRRTMETPATAIRAAAATAGAATTAGWKADDDAWTKRLSMSEQANKDKAYDLSAANAWNQANLQAKELDLKYNNPADVSGSVGGRSSRRSSESGSRGLSDAQWAKEREERELDKRIKNLRSRNMGLTQGGLTAGQSLRNQRIGGIV